MAEACRSARAPGGGGERQPLQRDPWPGHRPDARGRRAGAGGLDGPSPARSSHWSRAGRCSCSGGAVPTLAGSRWAWERGAKGGVDRHAGPGGDRGAGPHGAGSRRRRSPARCPRRGGWRVGARRGRDGRDVRSGCRGRASRSTTSSSSVSPRTGWWCASTPTRWSRCQVEPRPRGWRFRGSARPAERAWCWARSSMSPSPTSWRPGGTGCRARSGRPPPTDPGRSAIVRVVRIRLPRSLVAVSATGLRGNGGSGLRWGQTVGSTAPWRRIGSVGCGEPPAGSSRHPERLVADRGPLEHPGGAALVGAEQVGLLGAVGPDEPQRVGAVRREVGHPVGDDDRAVERRRVHQPHATAGSFEDDAGGVRCGEHG